jgi:hypothetical protein
VRVNDGPGFLHLLIDRIGLRLLGASDVEREQSLFDHSNILHDPLKIRIVLDKPRCGQEYLLISKDFQARAISSRKVLVR